MAAPKPLAPSGPGSPRTKPVVIFDFDGTLADTLVMSIRIFEQLTKRAEPFSQQEIMRLRGFNALHLARELRIRPWRVPWLLMRGRRVMRQQLDTIEIFDGIPEMLQRLAGQGVHMYIMSSNSPRNIRLLLRARGLEGYFTHIYGNVGVLGKSKRLRQALKTNRLDPAQVYYVGDESRDVEAAKRVGVAAVSVAWGFNNPELLMKHHPYALARTPVELADILLAVRD